MLTRREFIAFTAALGAGLAPGAAFADDGAIRFVDSNGAALEQGASASQLTPTGSYARAFLYTIDPSLSPESVFSAGQDAASEVAVSAAAPGLDVGSPEKAASTYASDDAGDASLFLEGDFTHLADSYRKMAALGNAAVCNQLASYVDEVVGLVQARQAAVAEEGPLRVFIACGENGIDYESFNYLQKNVFDHLNIACINNGIDATPPEGLPAVVTSREIIDARPDAVLFRDADVSGLNEKIDTPLSCLWWQGLSDKDAPIPARGIPRTAFSWLGAPLPAQCLGVLWLGSVLRPSTYGDVDVPSYAERFYELFVHSGITAAEADDVMAASEVAGL